MTDTPIPPTDTEDIALGGQPPIHAERWDIEDSGWQVYVYMLHDKPAVDVLGGVQLGDPVAFARRLSAVLASAADRAAELGSETKPLMLPLEAS